MISRLLLTIRTAVHLRPRQVIHRVLRSARGLVGQPRLRPPPGPVHLRPEIPALAGPLADRLASDALASTRARAELLRDGAFHAVGESVPVDEIRWDDPRGSHLFRYHLHYFDDAPGLAALARQGDVSAETRLRGLWEGWLEACAEGRGEGWDPYPLSARIPNWIQALVLLEGNLRETPEKGRSVGGHDAPGQTPRPIASRRLRDRILASLWTQADRLCRTIEYDLAGNHLLRNRSALVWAAATLEPAPLDLAKAVDALVEEVDRQVLSDGMHEERTPAYHARVLTDLLEAIELLRVVGSSVPARLDDHARGMRRVLPRFVRSDGGLHPLGDTTPHGDPRPSAVQHLADRILGPAATGPSLGSWHLPAAGFAGIKTEGLEIVFDCGPFGARHQPGHGHCDGLSFVLSVRGRPIVVDPGIAGYADDPWRTWARSTAAHNTVQVDGRDQTEIWDTFRAARRARPGGAGVVTDEGGVRLYGALTPYHAPRVRHEREIVVRGTGIEVRDRVHGVQGRRLDTRLHFAAGAAVSEAEPGRWQVSCEERVLEVEARGMESVRWESAPVFPAWGTVEEGPVLRGRIGAGRADPEEFGFRLHVG